MTKPTVDPPPAPKGWKNVGVELPTSVCDIINAANGADPAKGGMPFAMASIIGALPWIAVALYEALPPDEYHDFLRQMKGYMEQAWSIAAAKNPRRAFDTAFAAAKRSVQ
jgi:hypothetical protein